MTIQRRVPGPVATELAGGSGSVEAMSLVAEALHELHFAGIPARRHHTLADELRILDEQLEIAGRVHPGWSQRIERILRACENLAGRLPPPSIQGIHRDFYPDQAIVDGPRITLLDLDLYAFGDPALDVGNFVAHLTEQALRCYGDPNAFCDAERAMGERYVELSSEVTQNAVRTYATLTLARHIHISTRLPTRRHTTSDIVDLCEQRLDIAQRPPPAQK
jgi:aminoglycoside phosphotransferase (APT) family kinase protein